jgi:molecular chaperone HtpG
MEEEVNEEEGTKTIDEEKVTEHKLKARRKKRKRRIFSSRASIITYQQKQSTITRLQNEVMNDEYDEFYKVLTNDYEKHLAVKRFKTEGDVVFTVLLFVSKCALYDLFELKKKFNKSNFVFDAFLS